MAKRGVLNFPIVGVAKSNATLEQLIARAQASCTEYGGLDPDAFAILAKQLRYVDGDYADPNTFVQLKAALGGAQLPTHYLAIPPSMFGTVVQQLQRAGCTSPARVVLEKPFGRDLASAKALNATLHEVFPEDSIFRIDHFLAKKRCKTSSTSGTRTRFWIRSGTAATSRTCRSPWPKTSASKAAASYYEETGVIRDVIQNHLLQIVSYLAMEAPSSTYSEAVRDEQAKVLRTIRPISPEHMVRGQFPRLPR